MNRTAIVEPFLSEVSAGFVALLYLGDESVGHRNFPVTDRWAAEAFAADWEQGVIQLEGI